MPVPPFLKDPLTLYQVAEQYWDLKAYPTQYVFSLLSQVSDDKLERDKCIELSSPEGQEDYLNYSRRPKRTILEVLHDFHKTASKLTIEILFELFSSIKPRSFSIASGPSTDKLDMLVAVVKYHTILKKAREGLCSNWLKGLKEHDKVYGWVKKGTLTFPDNAATPLILIGPGTGLAPFRSLIQDRTLRSTASKDTLYLFFGCRYKERDFHCKEELEGLVEEGKLSLFCAFSRDQDNKIYVQHKIAEQKDLLWDLINNRQAYVYISGNSKNMPDNVKDAFLEDVFGKTGGLDKDRSKSLLKAMEDKGRLLVETW
ncbi:FAD binding domain-containing protein [Phthorimaea operculella]|nr:FAD binding domain-containing protein [Phthorimaea operculella]